jgi:ABC-type spermidine/putrescine transport system permease subunit I
VGSNLETSRLSRRERKRVERTPRGGQGAWYPRWFWPSFAIPAIVWQAVFFLLALYVIVAVAFGTTDFFRNPVPIYQPWYWDFETFRETLSRVITDSFQQVYLRTFAYVAVASLLCLLIGFPVAYFVARYGGRRKILFVVLLVLPFWISYLMRMFAWQSLLADDGFVNDILHRAGLIGAPIEWLAGKDATVILGLVYGYVPFMILPLFGQLDRIEQSMLEAGRDLGASPWQTFWRVTVPLSKPAILAGLIIVALPMFGDYYTNNLLSNSPKTTMIGNLIDLSYASPGRAMQGASLVLTVVALLLIPMTWYVRNFARAAEGR